MREVGYVSYVNFFLIFIPDSSIVPPLFNGGRGPDDGDEKEGRAPGHARITEGKMGECIIVLTIVVCHWHKLQNVLF